MNLEFDKAIDCVVPEKILNKVKKYSNVIVFGAGQSGDWVVDLLRQHEIYPKLFCDNYADKWGKEKNNLRIESFEKAMELYPDAAICIASMWAEDIKKQIIEFDEKLSDRTWDLLFTMAWETPLSSGESNEKEYILQNLERFEALSENLYDMESKKVLEGILNYRLTRKKKYLSLIKSDEITYLDKTIIDERNKKKIQEGIIVDGGAFDGDTIELFIENWGNDSNLEIHSYEPGKANCKKIKDKMSNWKNHKIVVYNSALWNESSAEKGFEENGLSGKIEDNSQNKIKFSTIDEYNFKNVSFIKLDIEGAEREALNGAVETIKRCKPILAICAYHLQDDILVLSDFIKKLDCNYKIMLRHYMYSSGDTILYGIPMK